MRKNQNYLMLCVIAVLCAISFCFCKDDKEEPKAKGDLETGYITVENAQFHKGDFPSATSNTTLDDVEISDKVMNGAANFITVATDYEVAKFFLGIRGVDGYLEYVPEKTRASYENVYVIPLMIAQDFSGDATLKLSAELENGEVTKPNEYVLNQLETREGALEIKLAFSNEKDVDIHLFTPSGLHIYFDTSGDGYYWGEYDEGDAKALPFGLDIDSNAGCNIDGVNKENIYIPEEYVENGTYRVAVDLYENCDPSIPTSWSVTARYNGNLITPVSGKNPASGVFEIGAPSSFEAHLVDVMTFKISGARQSKAVLDGSRKNIRMKSEIRLSDSQETKRRMKK